MTSIEIAEKLSCIPEKDIELLTGMMLAAKSGDDRRLLIDMLDRVNEYAYLTENGIPLGDIAYRDFVMGNCPIDAPSPETVEQFRKTIDAAEAGDAEAQYTAAMMAMEGAVGLPVAAKGCRNRASRRTLRARHLPPQRRGDAAGRHRRRAPARERCRPRQCRRDADAGVNLARRQGRSG